MFRNLVDAVLEHQAAPVIIVLAQICVLAWAVAFRGGLKPILVVNITIAAVVLLYNTGYLEIAIRYGEYERIWLMVFEGITLVTSAAALGRLPVPAWIVWTCFAVNFAMCLALMVFMLTFRLTRLF